MNLKTIINRTILMVAIVGVLASCTTSKKKQEDNQAPQKTLKIAYLPITHALPLFVANELRHVGRRLDEGEFLDVVPMKLESALEHVWCGDITDIKTVAGLLWLKSAPAALMST